MAKVKVKVMFLGTPPHAIDMKRINDWKSKLFEVTESSDRITITSNADLDDWGFSDGNISQLIPKRGNEDVLVIVTTVPLENNYYVRRFTNNRIAVTLFEVGDILKAENIPLGNMILRVIYSASFLFKRYGNTIPETVDFPNFTHDETKGCIFDMNGIKNDIIYSANKPTLCDDCAHSLTLAKVEINIIDSVKTEFKEIKKPLYYRISDLIKEYPICAIIFSSVAAILLGAIGSLLASAIWERIR
jgi:hypothetical protein